MTAPAEMAAGVPGEPPLFSIVIPTYNRRDQVMQAVASALDQLVEDVEVIVADDGSTDGTIEALATIDDRRLKILPTERNGGASAARNRGIAAAQGRYVAFLDSDDRFLPFHLTDLLPLLAQSEDVVAYSRVVVDRGGGKSFLKPHRAIRVDEGMDRYLMCDRGFIQTSSLALSRRMAEHVRYREDVGFGDDTDFAVRLSLAGGRFLMAPRASVIWADRQTEQRLSQVRSSIGSLAWLRDLKPHISPRAYMAYMGWHAAKSIWPTSPREALGHYFEAVRHGAFGPTVAAIVLMQIVVPDRVYREAANRWVSFTSLLRGSRL